MIKQVCIQWTLDSVSVIDADGTCSWVAYAIQHGAKDVVVKIGMPHMESRDEALGLRIWQSVSDSPAIALYEHDVDMNAMLIEPCLPGTSLKACSESEQDAVISTALQDLWRCSPSDALQQGVRKLDEMVHCWCSLAKSSCVEPANVAHVKHGCKLFEHLLASTQQTALLATDLHAGNILSATRKPWLVIDPKPFVGDPAYDLTQHMLNCPERLQTDPWALVNTLSSLTALDAERVAMWLAARLLIDVNSDAEKITLATVLLSSDH